MYVKLTPVVTMEIGHKETLSEGPLECRGRPEVGEDGRVGAPGVAVNCGLFRYPISSCTTFLLFKEPF